MEFKQEDGTKLYGFSQINLEDNNRLLQANTEAILEKNKVEKKRTIIIGIIGIGGLAYILWLTYYVMKWNVINNIVHGCGGCL